MNNAAAVSVSHSTGSWDDPGDFTVGVFAPGVDERLWDGLISLMGFWKRTLTADEKTWLYNGGIGRTYAEVLATNSSGVSAATQYRTFPKFFMQRPVTEIREGRLT